MGVPYFALLKVATLETFEPPHTTTDMLMLSDKHTAIAPIKELEREMRSRQTGEKHANAITSTLIDKEKQALQKEALQKRGVQLERYEETNRLWETQPSHTTTDMLMLTDKE